MQVMPTRIPEVLVVVPRVIGDERGFFMETFSAERYAAAGIRGPFVQDNLSSSARGVLRGLHIQHPYGQGKLVSVLEGEVFDVAVDVRAGSPTCGQWVGELLSSENRRQLWIPAGFAHGFLVTSDRALLAYKCTERYHAETERAIAWDDPDLAIEWPTRDVSLSARDRAAVRLRDLDPSSLPGHG